MIPKKLMVLGFVALAITGMASATYSGDAGEYALSEEVEEYDTTSEENLLEFSDSALENEEVYVELLNDGVVQDDFTEDADSSGELDVTLDDNEDVDQVAVYSTDEEFEADDVTEVTHYYDYDGTSDGEDDSANYDENQVYDEFTVEDVDDSALQLLELIVPWLIVIAVIGAFARDM